MRPSSSRPSQTASKRPPAATGRSSASSRTTSPSRVDDRERDAAGLAQAGTRSSPRRVALADRREDLGDLRRGDRRALELQPLGDAERGRGGAEQRRARRRAGRGGARRASVVRLSGILPEMKRAADPYLDTDVIDARAPRVNQAVVGVLSLVAVTVGPWWLLALLGAAARARPARSAAAGASPASSTSRCCSRASARARSRTRGRRASRTWSALVVLGRRLSPTSPASMPLGAVLGGLVAALALLAAATGFCAGCRRTSSAICSPGGRSSAARCRRSRGASSSSSAVQLSGGGFHGGSLQVRSPYCGKSLTWCA